MPRYRIRAYCTNSAYETELYKVQQKCWWGWKTVARRLSCARDAYDIVRNLEIAHEKTEYDND